MLLFNAYTRITAESLILIYNVFIAHLFHRTTINEYLFLKLYEYIRFSLFQVKCTDESFIQRKQDPQTSKTMTHSISP